MRSRIKGQLRMEEYLIFTVGLILGALMLALFTTLVRWLKPDGVRALKHGFCPDCKKFIPLVYIPKLSDHKDNDGVVDCFGSGHFIKTKRS
jgi:hypothetical protein